MSNVQMNINDLLESFYNDALQSVGSGSEIKSILDFEIKTFLNLILEKSESSKAVLTVILTSAVYKFTSPTQDIRNHQTSISQGYSGRTFDTKYITPFLKEKQFPAMSTSGWLTRSLEQKVPYNHEYSGAINPPQIKNAFLHIIDEIQKNLNNEEIIKYIFQGLIIQRNAQKIDLAKPLNLPISTIIHLLDQHFIKKYVSDGAARLPVLALYAVYECLIKELKRFDGKKLLPLESHTSADARSGRIGDIDIIDENDRQFEAVEVKHGIPISVQLVRDAFEKFKTTQVNRYYLLSTVNIDQQQIIQINIEIERIKNIHGCHVIVNGLVSSLGYYLRLLNNTSDFIDYYVNLLENDKALKFEHKEAWNEIIASM